MRRRPFGLLQRLKRPHVIAIAIAAFIPGGCCGVSSNPFRFGNWPSSDIKQTHAKPKGFGYYGNFDPKAAQLTVTPLESTSPVRKQVVLIATVCDDKNNGLRNRRVEWHVTGVGHIVEVDESGCFPGRGYLVDDKYAVSYTNYRSHVITRGNDDPNDDIHLKPGQTWCVITSPEEGDTFVTVNAPGIHNWDKHKVFAITHWIDAQPFFPPPAVNPAGQPHTLTTKIIRSSDRSPASGVRVRYRLLDGPPAVFEPGGAPQVEIFSDPQGNASAILKQVQPVPGVNRILVEVSRPGERGREFMIAAQETSKTWVSPQVAIQKVGPPVVVVGQEIPYQIIVSNTGSVATQGLTIRDSIAETLQLVGANPPATQQGPNLFWSFGAMQPGQTVAVQFTARATQPGSITNCAEAVLAEGQAARSCVTTQVVAGALAVVKSGPANAYVGQPVTFQITVTNPGNGPVTGVVVTDAFDQGFVHESGVGPVALQVGNLGPGESRIVPITLMPRTTGRLCNRVTAQAASGQSASSEHCMEVVQPQLTITKTGPKVAIVGAPVEFEVAVRNVGSIPATNVILRDTLPPEFTLQGVPVGGAVQGNGVVYNLGVLAPGEQRSLKLQAVANVAGPQICNMAEITADGNVLVRAQACVEVRGVPGLGTELIDRLDPVPVGGETTYTVRVTNQGSTPMNEVVLNCLIPDGFEFVDAEGAVPHRFDAPNRTVIFEPFNGMAPKRQLLYQVQVKAQRVGDFRFECRVGAKELKAPVLFQESTRAYNPATGDVSAIQKKDSPAASTASLPKPASEAPVTSNQGTPADGQAVPDSKQASAANPAGSTAAPTVSVAPARPATVRITPVETAPTSPALAQPASTPASTVVPSGTPQGMPRPAPAGTAKDPGAPVSPPPPGLGETKGGAESAILVPVETDGTPVSTGTATRNAEPAPKPANSSLRGDQKSLPARDANKFELPTPPLPPLDPKSPADALPQVAVERR